MPDYKPVPVHIARQVGQGFEKSVVIIVTYNDEHELFHFTTWGKDSDSQVAAAKLGEQVCAFVGASFAERTTFEDFRDFRKLELGVADSNGTPIKIGDFVRRPTPHKSSPHGEWAVSQVIMHAGFPVLSYCYSQKGKVLPTGYSRGFLSDCYCHKTLLWINDGHFTEPEDEEVIVLKPEEVDMALVAQEELTPHGERK